MTNGELKLLASLAEPGGFREAGEHYNTLKSWYVQEYGLGWFLKEVDEARDEITMSMNRKRGNVPLAVEYLFRQNAPENFKSVCFIGTKQVTGIEFSLYSKGLYFMAGYLMIREKQVN